MYFLLRFFLRLALKIYCPHIRIQDKSFLQAKGPLILACNHPNSFLDAVILATLMKRPVHFLAVGEVTDQFLFGRIMKMLRIIPVYILKDKPDNSGKNDQSFSACVKVLKNEGILVIFSEGISENNWKLRRIKKMTARIVSAAFQDQLIQSRLRLIPVGLNYNSFDGPGKTILIRFGEPILLEEFLVEGNDHEKISMLTELIRERLYGVMLQSEDASGIQSAISNSKTKGFSEIKKELDNPEFVNEGWTYSNLKKPGYLISGDRYSVFIFYFLLCIPGILGWILHVLLYYPVKSIVKKNTNPSVYFDSVLFTCLFLIYPIYWLVLNIIVYFLFKNVWIQFLFIFMPVFAIGAVYWKENGERIRNYFILLKLKES
jgi:1-acyl-sn-glycerol-3-phosphate acyltransferase